MNIRRHPTQRPHLSAPTRGAGRRPLRIVSGTLCAGVAMACAVQTLPAAAQGTTAPAAATQEQRFDIPPGPLNAAITRFVAETGVLVAGDATLTAGKTSPGVQGRFAADEALRRLLAGTGLTVQRQQGGGYGLAVAAPAVAAAPAAPLPHASPRPAAPAALPTQTLEPVLVSARRPANDRIVVRRSTGGALFGESDLREVPFSVNIVGEAEIRNRQATTLSEMLSTDPSIGFEYQDAGGMPFDRLSIRGFTQSNQVINGQLTGLDVVAQQSESVDRVEVLRGPAAFRYGFVNPGGVVNVVTKRPTTGPSTTVTALGAADSQLGVHLDHSSHFDEAARFGYRVNAVFSDGDVPIDTTQRRRGLLALATDFKFSPDLTVYADLQYSDVRARGGSAFFPNFQVATDGRVLGPIDPRRTVQPEWNELSASALSAGLEIEYRFSDAWQLRSMFRRIDAEDSGYGGVTFYDPFQPNGDFVLANYGYRNDYSTASNVTFLQGQFDTGSVAHRLTVGASWLDAELDGFYAQNNNSARQPSNLFNPSNLPFTEPGPDIPGFSIQEEQVGAFLSDEMRIGDWRPLIGVRWSRLEYDATFNTGGSRSSEVTPLLALSYGLSPAATVYTSYAKGLENGGLAPLGTTNANQQMPPLETEGWELGVKSDLLGGAATLDAALFRAEKTAAFTDAGNTYVQQGVQVHTGVELMAKGRFWQPLELSTGLTYIDAELKDDPATAGNRPVNVPRLSAVFFGDYALAALPGLHLTGQINYRSARDYNLPNRNELGGYSLLGAGMRYQTRVGERRAVLRLNVDNLNNKAYYKMIDTFGGTLGAPRTVKASLEVQLR